MNNEEQKWEHIFLLSVFSTNPTFLLTLCRGKAMLDDHPPPQYLMLTCHIFIIAKK